MRRTKKKYEEMLNELSPHFESDEWIIGGKRRDRHATNKWYGAATRKYDPIGFNIGYNEWKTQ